MRYKDIRREFEIEVVALRSGAPKAEQQRGHRGKVRKLGGTMLEAALGVNQTAASNYQLIGGGVDSVVYRHVVAREVDEIVKIHMPDFPTKRKLHEKKNTIIVHYSILKEYLGDYLPDQNTGIGPHPFMPHHTVVKTFQQYHAGTAFDVFDGDSPKLKIPVWHNMSQQFPTAFKQLPDFIAKSRLLSEERCEWPDIIDPNNLIIDDITQKLLLLDTIPRRAVWNAGNSQHPKPDEIAERFDSLEAGLTLLRQQLH